MVERSRAARSAAVLAVACLALPFAPGCGALAAPRGRVEEAHKLVQSLRAENSQLKDASLNLKARNQDLAQRAVDDARALHALESANAQYERSIQGYQDDREQYQAAYRDLKSHSPR